MLNFIAVIEQMPNDTDRVGIVRICGLVQVVELTRYGDKKIVNSYKDTGRRILFHRNTYYPGQILRVGQLVSVEAWNTKDAPHIVAYRVTKSDGELGL